MTSFDISLSGSLRWVKVGAEAELYQLQKGQDVIGRLTWNSRCGTLADAECAEGRWTFKRVGCFDPFVTVRAYGSERTLATFRPRLSGGGLLELEHGNVIEFNASDLWGHRWVFLEPEGSVLLDIRVDHGGGFLGALRPEGIIDIREASVMKPELPLVLCLGWYLILLLEREMDPTMAATLAALV